MTAPATKAPAKPAPPGDTGGAAILAKLVSLANSAGELHFERLTLCHRLLQDHAWVESPDGGGGDEVEALRRLEALAFSDITGFASLGELLRIFQFFPSANDWKRERFDFRKMVLEVRRRTEKRQPTTQRESSVPRNNLTPPLSFPELYPSKQKVEYSRAFNLAESFKERFKREQAARVKLEEEVRRLRPLAAKAEKLEAENEELRKQLAAIRAVFGRATA